MIFLVPFVVQWGSQVGIGERSIKVGRLESCHLAGKHKNANFPSGGGGPTWGMLFLVPSLKWG